MMPTQSITRAGNAFNEDTAVEAICSVASINVSYMH